MSGVSFYLWGVSMQSKMTIVLSDQEREALQHVARQELRGISSQARHMLRFELSRRGFLPIAEGEHDEGQEKGKVDDQ